MVPVRLLLLLLLPVAAPLEVLDLLIDNLARGGLLGFSFNDRTLADPAFEGRLQKAVEDGRVHVLFQEYGEHLPKFNMKATVYIIEKA